MLRHGDQGVVPLLRIGGETSYEGSAGEEESEYVRGGAHSDKVIIEMG